MVNFLTTTTTAGKACIGIRQQQDHSSCYMTATVVPKCTQLSKLSHLFTAHQILSLFFFFFFIKLESLEGTAKINCIENSSCDKQQHDVREDPPPSCLSQIDVERRKEWWSVGLSQNYPSTSIITLRLLIRVYHPSGLAGGNHHLFRHYDLFIFFSSTTV